MLQKFKNGEAEQEVDLGERRQVNFRQVVVKEKNKAFYLETSL